MADELDNGAPAPEISGLDRIEQEARAFELDTSDEPAKTGETEMDGVSQAQVWAQIPLQVGALLAMALPELDGVYTEPRCLAWGHGMAAVANKYGWDAGEAVGKFAPELMLLAATIPLAVPTVQAFKKRRKEAEIIEASPKAQPLTENGSQGPNNAPNGGLPTPGGFVEPS